MMHHNTSTMQFCVDLSNSDHLNMIIDQPPPPESTHEAIAVEAIASMPDSDHLKQRSSQQQLSIDPPRMNT